MYSAYCMTPFLGSWLGRTTSRRLERSIEEASRTGDTEVGVEKPRVAMDAVGTTLGATHPDRRARDRVVDNIAIEGVETFTRLTKWRGREEEGRSDECQESDNGI